MSANDLFEQFKTLAQKYLGDPPTEEEQARQKEQAEQTQQDSFSTAGKDRVRAVIDDFLAITPLIEQAGYKITNLDIELGLLPKLIPHFRKIGDIDEAQKQQILSQVGDKKLMKLLISALFKADSFQNSLNMKNYDFKGIEVEIAPLPAVRLNYTHLSQRSEPSKDLSE